MSQIQLKYRCTKKELDGEMTAISLEPVPSGEAEAFIFTPRGKMIVGDVGKEVADQFEVGKHYICDFAFSEAPAEAPVDAPPANPVVPAVA